MCWRRYYSSMTNVADWQDELREDAIAGERRQDRRYQLGLELRWRLIRRRKVRDSGIGRTIDVSSGGILFDAHRQLPVGLNMEVSISWPVLLHNVAPLQLVVTGRIVRVNGNQVAIRMNQHEFRTTGLPADSRPLLPRNPPPLFSKGGFSGFGKIQ